jgi:type 1 glutamine amidotransferase
MKVKSSMPQLLVAGICAAALGTGALGVLQAQAPAPGQAAGAAGRGAAGRGGGAAPGVFSVADLNKDGVVTRAELMTALEQWFGAADTAKAGTITQDQLATVLNAALPAPPAPGPGRANQPQCGGQSANPHTACPEDVAKMMAALPDKAYAKPAKARKILVLDSSLGFRHPSIPLAAETIKAMGEKTKAWTTVVTYDAADINTENLKQYDAIFLDSTTGCFLDKAGDPAETNARRAALLAFVRSGKGLAGIHAATDSYHSPCPNDPQPAGRAGGGAGRAGGFGQGTQLAAQIVTQADKNNDQKLSLVELDALADTWFDKIDTNKTGRVSQADFASGFAAALPPAAGGAGARGAGPNAGTTPVARGSGPQGVGSWPEFNKMIGGFFKFHWVDPQLITVKIDDPKSPLTQMFGSKEWDIHDETYTFAQDSFSRTNVHVLTSIDYGKMSDADKAIEPAGTARMDGDYALSYIRKEGLGRVFYEAHGHAERNYAVTPLLQHILAGVQYALGDLKADDSPSVKPAGAKK